MKTKSIRILGMALTVGLALVGFSQSAAAQVACGDTISVDTTLTGDMDCSATASPALIIDTDGIILNGDGFTIQTGDAEAIGIEMSGTTGVTVTNLLLFGNDSTEMGINITDTTGAVIAGVGFLQFATTGVFQDGGVTSPTFVSNLFLRSPIGLLLSDLGGGVPVDGTVTIIGNQFSVLSQGLIAEFSSAATLNMTNNKFLGVAGGFALIDLQTPALITNNGYELADTGSLIGPPFGGALVSENETITGVTVRERVCGVANDTGFGMIDFGGSGNLFQGGYARSEFGVVLDSTTDAVVDAQFANNGENVFEDSTTNSTITETFAEDADLNGENDVCDPLPADYDLDHVLNEDDNCPMIDNFDQADADGDGVGDACDQTNNLDVDGDGVDNDADNCPFADNNGQEDTDGDGVGDACDTTDGLDVDGDGVDNDDDNCPFADNADQDDEDSDGLGDACDDSNGLDADDDGVDNEDDNCPFDENDDQEDADGDGLGDACDDSDGLDADGDGVLNADDNCPFADNADQADEDSDGLGDACDPLALFDDGCSVAGNSLGSSWILIGLALCLVRRRRRTSVCAKEGQQ